MNTKWNSLEQYKKEVDEIKASVELKGRLKEFLAAESEAGFQSDIRAEILAGEAAETLERNAKESVGSDFSGRRSTVVRKKKTKYRKIAAAAAICILAAGAFVWSHLNQQASPHLTAEDPSLGNSGDSTEQAIGFDWDNAELVNGLPKVWVAAFNYGMGSGALAAHNAGEFENGNPWSADLQLETLPVFWNTARARGSGAIVKGGLTERQMLEKVEEIAAALDVRLTDTKTDAENDRTIGLADFDRVYAVTGICKNVRITVERNGDTSIFFTESRDTPPFTALASDAPLLEHYPVNPSSREDFEMVTEELYQLFKDVLGWDNLTSSVTSDRFFDGGTNWGEAAYSKTGNLTEQILGFNFRKISYAVEGSRLWILRFIDTDLSAKLGDYPIISATQAREKLLTGDYVTVEPEYGPHEGTIERVELVYLNDRFQEYFIPCYKFYVELPQMVEDYSIADGLNMYAVYYVPAIESEYLSVADDLEVYYN